MNIRDLFALPGTSVSFEFFPPQTEAAESTLFREVVPALKELRPRFFSVTYGAGGGTRGKTLGVVDRIRREFAVEAMAHLTCVGSTTEALSGVLDEILSLVGQPAAARRNGNGSANGNGRNRGIHPNGNGASRRRLGRRPSVDLPALPDPRPPGGAVAGGGSGE